MTDLSQATRLSIAGISCAGCVASVEGALKGVSDVTEATVNVQDTTRAARPI